MMTIQQKKSIKNNKTIKIMQVCSAIGCTALQKKNLCALGLKKINMVKSLNDTPSLRGILKKVHHLVKIIDVE